MPRGTKLTDEQRRINKRELTRQWRINNPDAWKKTSTASAKYYYYNNRDECNEKAKVRRLLKGEFDRLSHILLD